MYTNDREAYRQFFFTVWQKHLHQAPMSPAEQQLLQIILQHPEYHRHLTPGKHNEQQEFALEENPFFHMSMHQAIQDQLTTGRPDGIRGVQQTLKARYHHDHDVEHLMMQCLYSMMVKAQQNGEMPTDEDYLKALNEIQ